MNAITVASWAVRVTGAVVLLLGLVIWTGNGVPIRPVHMLLGVVLVGSLWTLAFLAARAGVPAALVVVAFAWGLLTIALGLTQERILVGDGHWVVQVGHLLVGIGAIGIGEAIAARARRSAPGLPAA